MLGKLIFISHSSKDAKIADGICEYLESNGNECFIAPRNIRSGREYAEEIVDGIDNSEVMVLVVSKNSNNSPHVLREVERAVSKRIPVVIYKLEDVELSKSMEYFIMTHQWIDAKKNGKYSEILECIENVRNKSAGRIYTEDDEAEEPHEKSTERFYSKALKTASGVLVALILICIISFVSFILPEKDNTDNAKQTLSQKINIGDTIVFGTYNGEPVEWRVLKLSEDNSEAVIISEYILTMKAFAAPESGKYNNDGTTSYWVSESATDTDMQLQAYVRGNSDWQKSDIRTWLNSDKETVVYEGQPPVAAAMSELKNGYNTEKGFLSGFSADELATIKETEIVTNGNVLSEEVQITTTDRVYLLSSEELIWLDEAGISMFTKPTDKAVEQDETNWYSMLSLGNNVETYYWWLRDPVVEEASKCHVVGNGYDAESMLAKNAALEGFGIRPAMTVDIRSESIVVK